MTAASYCDLMYTRHKDEEGRHHQNEYEVHQLLYSASTIYHKGYFGHFPKRSKWRSPFFLLYKVNTPNSLSCNFTSFIANGSELFFSAFMNFSLLIDRYSRPFYALRKVQAYYRSKIKTWKLFKLRKPTVTD